MVVNFLQFSFPFCLIDSLIEGETRSGVTVVCISHVPLISPVKLMYGEGVKVLNVLSGPELPTCLYSVQTYVTTCQKCMNI